MSTATWGESEFKASEKYSPSLLRQLLQQMIAQFDTAAGCIALFNESKGQMEICLHLRVAKNAAQAAPSQNGMPAESSATSRRLATVPLASDPASSAIERVKLSNSAPSMDELEEVTPRQSSLFPVGSTYAPGHDIIGYAWIKNETYIMRHDDYLSFFYTGPQPVQSDVTPSSYLVTPFQEIGAADEIKGQKKAAQTLGVVILYQTLAGTSFQQKQIAEAHNFAEHLSLYIQNDYLRRRQMRIREYLQKLQEISAVFPSTVQLATLVEKVYEFVASVVDVSSMLMTLYDRDTKMIYDIFAVQQGRRVEDLTERPLVIQPSDRPVWWRITQEENRRILLDAAQLDRSGYDELLTGVWGDQRSAGTFLLLPMKMFNRVIGSLCLTSLHAHAYQAEEIQVLETMVQIITVSIENAKLYDRSRQALREARQREEALAGLNSALQSISTVLNTSELVQKFVEIGEQAGAGQDEHFLSAVCGQKFSHRPGSLRAQEKNS